MCLAIYKPKGKVIPKEHLENAFLANSDGAGFAYVEKKEVHIIKGFMNFEDFWAAYEPVQKLQAIVHFRLATTGAVESENTHPFRVGEFAMIHNGIIDIQPLEGLTDTQTFADLVIAPILEQYGNNTLTNASIRFLIESAIGGSKLVFLHGSGAFHILNESLGHWAEGIWYSNRSYELPSFRVFSGLYSHTIDDEPDPLGIAAMSRSEIVATIDRLEQQIHSETSDKIIAEIYDELEILEDELIERDEIESYFGYNEKE